MDVADRRHKLDAAVADYVARERGRVAFQGDDSAVVITGRPVNHVLHLLLTIITGLWIVVWIYASATGGERSRTFRVDESGVVTSETERTVNTGAVRWPRVGGALLIVAGLVAAVALTSPLRWLGLLVAAGGVAIMVLDIRQYGTGKSVTAVERV